MKRRNNRATFGRAKMFLLFAGICIGILLTSPALAFVLNVTGSGEGPVGSYRWLLEEDTTFQISPGHNDPQLTLNFHRSYMPVVAKGTSADLSPLDDPAVVNPARHYFISILPDNAGTDGGYTMGGTQVKPGQETANITVNQLPLPTAQITVFVFEDNHPINNAPNLPQEKGLAGFKVTITDAGGRYGISGGQQMLDAFGEPIVPVYTDVNGFAVIKNLSPGKYAVQVIPPAGQGWQQTTTIEGSRVIDAWVKADEPELLIEFGVPSTHVFVGFVQQFMDTAALNGNYSISGQVVNFHMARPPEISFSAAANNFQNVYVALNDSAGKGIYAQPADPDTGEFTIDGVPPGTYLLVVWDKYLDVIISFQNVNITDASVDLGQLAVPAWFGRLDSYVFYDANQNGIRDPGEMGMPEQAVNLRFRDGSMYQSFPTDLDGYAPFDEIFPFFHWLVAEVDFLRFKATGATIVVDTGGVISDPSKYDGVLEPQPQPENGDADFRVETGEVLTQGFQSFAGLTNRIEWGKAAYADDENGGISGIVFYAVTRAENDPRYAAGEPWEPGIPRVQVNLYADGDVDNPPQGNWPGSEDHDWNDDGVFDLPDGVIDDVDGDGVVTLADVDNYPFQWAPQHQFLEDDAENPIWTGSPGPEDIDHNGNEEFDMGDAIQITWTDSWDENLPTDCPGDPHDLGYLDAKCYDGLRNWNQVRPAVFDGGYAFGDLSPGTYIIEVVPPPGYETVKEEDKNVDFGDTYTPSLQLLPPVCVGDPHTVPAELALFPGIEAPFAGQERPLCDRKQVILAQAQNAAADFFLFTEVPVAAHFTGLITNDLGNEFNPNNPTFSEKASAPFIPVSMRDYQGREVTRVYGDRYGAYNGLVPSTYTTNIANPSGMSPAMYSVCINDPGPVTNADGTSVFPDPNYRREYTTSCYTFMFMPGTTTYLDTPVMPLSAFAGQYTHPLDAQFADGTPVIATVEGGALVDAEGTITISSLGTTAVPNPDYIQDESGSQPTINRDYGFGAAQGTVTVGGTELTIITWTNASISATVPAGVSTGQLMVERGDNGLSTVVGLTLTVGPYTDGVVRNVAEGQSIQAAIDDASDGDLILVHRGTFDELVILYKNVKLQGSGAATEINAIKAPPEKATNWRVKVTELVNTEAVDLLPGQDPSFSFFPNTGLFPTELGPGILVMGKETAPLDAARIDGFTIRGADSGGAILVNGYTENLAISNNRIRSNHGTFSAGIRVGHPVTPFAFSNMVIDAHNPGIVIHHNDISQNGATGGGFEGATGGAGGGISIYNGAHGYQIHDNWIVGNFTTMSGAGIGHFGRSENGLIKDNIIAFNQSFHQSVNNATGGGIAIEGILPSGGGLSEGSGSVTIEHNRIQGNLAGAGDGGGIRLLNTNGQDVAEAPGDPAAWDQITIINNFIVNNISGLAGAGISLQEAARVSITNNTIAHNDSTATSGPAFTTGVTGVAAPQPSGIVSRAFSPGLRATLGGTADFPDPDIDSNIIWENRSFYFDITQNFPYGGLVLLDDAWDLGVLGATGQLNPTNGILTSLGPHPIDGAVYSDTNNAVDPVFEDAYFNTVAGDVVVEDRTTIFEAAAALDEGGNFIDLRFGPLYLTGDYNSDAAVGAQVFATPATATTTISSGGGGSCFISAVSEQSRLHGRLLSFLFVGAVLILVGTGLRRKFKHYFPAGAAKLLMLLTLITLFAFASTEAGAEVVVQCPGDIDGDAIPDEFLSDGETPNPEYDPNVVCIHLAAGDGFTNMTDGKLQYMFGFADVTGTPPDMVMMKGMFAANFPAPTIKVKEGQKLYLTLTNVGMMARPDLFDPHTVHYHGFPNAAAVFDGVPDASISINMGASLTYFYVNVEPGTFIYHCHVEATEHMQMGMLGQIYVTPKQDGTAVADPDGSGRTYTKFAYNDGDGSTGYDVDYPIQIASFDPDFHDASLEVQPLPFALMEDRYPLLNGRGYPDTVNPDELMTTAHMEGYMMEDPFTRKLNALVTATKGQKILLRLSSLSTTSYHTLSVLGIPMQVVGKGARLLRGPDGKNLYYHTNSVDLGGGETADVILDTKDVAPGTYFLYAKNLSHLSNDAEDFGGMMTEIRVSAAQ
jgi:large repetitive protein